MNKIERDNRADFIDNFWEITLPTGEILNEIDYTWRDFSEEITVKYQENNKVVKVATIPIKSIKIVVGYNETIIDIPEDCQVYQSIRSQTIYIPSQGYKAQLVGRFVGLVENGKVIEERFVTKNDVTGFKA